MPQVALESLHQTEVGAAEVQGMEGKVLRWWLDSPFEKGLNISLNSHLLWELYLALPTACPCPDEVYL